MTPSTSPPTASGPIPGSLRKRLRAWRGITQDRWVLRIIKRGLKLPFRYRPVSVFQPNRPLSEAYTAFVTEEIARLLATSAITCVEERPCMCLPLGVVPKKNGKLRLIHDLRRLNAQLHDPAHFKMEDLSVVAPQLESGDQMMTLDLDQAYHHVEIHPAHRKYLGFEWQGKYYVWNVLPFGLSISPLVFTKVLRPVVAHLRERQGQRVNLYLDDWLLLVRRGQDPSTQLQRLLALLHELGLHVNLAKSSLTPSQTVSYLGMEISTVGRPQFRVPQEKLHKIRHEISRALRVETITGRTLARVAGLCVSVLRAVLPGRMFLRNVHRQIARAGDDLEVRMRLSLGARSDLEWWLSALRQWNGSQAVPLPTDSVLTTDASSSGWGATYLGLKARGDWSQSMARQYSNVRELSAVLLSLRAFRAQLSGRSVLLRSDNVTTVACVNRLVGRSQTLNEVVREIFSFCHAHGITLRALWIPGVTNTEADLLSRKADPNDWQVSELAFFMLEHKYGPHTVDRMASSENSKLARFNSRLHDPAAEAVNCFSVDWAGENNYVAPPIALIPAVLQHLIKCGAEATLVAPVWPSAWWWGLLSSLSTAPPFPLPPRASFLVGPSGRPGPLKNPRWRFAAFRVAGSRIAGSRI